MYELYVDGRRKEEVVSVSTYKKIFYENFNLKFKTLKKDTCNKCDTLNIQKANATNEEAERTVETELNEHHLLWEEAQRKMKQDLKFAENNDYFECLTYDLEKTLPLPRLPTNIIFYKRQLWVYNCGIHSGKEKRGFCYTWVEGTAGRGAQEVGSSLLRHIKEQLRPNISELVLWSDSCGGQNRNIKLVLMLKCALTSHPTLKKITLRYLISGHSFLPNDDDFGKIEASLKRQQRLYTPEDYFKVMATCRKKNSFVISPMKTEHFWGISTKVDKMITNRKKGIHGEEVSWLKTREIILLKEKPFSLFMRQDFSSENITEIDIAKKIKGRRPPAMEISDLNVLWPHGKGIAAEKLKDIKSIWHLLPQDTLTFYYNTLFVDDSVEDDLEGFGGSPDFELLEEP